MSIVIKKAIFRVSSKRPSKLPRKLAKLTPVTATNTMFLLFYRRRMRSAEFRAELWPKEAVIESLESSIKELAHLMRGRQTLVLSGAGVSTESGIPDYRGPQGALQTRRQPMQYRDFVGSEDARRRH
jgi:hypothetical protein